MKKSKEKKQEQSSIIDRFIDGKCEVQNQKEKTKVIDALCAEGIGYKVYDCPVVKNNEVAGFKTTIFIDK